MNVTIQPNPNETGKSWCHNCQEKHHLFVIYGFRKYGGWTNLCRFCLEDLGVIPPSAEVNGQTPIFAAAPEPVAPPPASFVKKPFDGTYPNPPERPAGFIAPPPPGTS